MVAKKQRLKTKTEAADNIQILPPENAHTGVPRLDKRASVASYIRSTN